MIPAFIISRGHSKIFQRKLVFMGHQDLTSSMVHRMGMGLAWTFYVIYMGYIWALWHGLYN